MKKVTERMGFEEASKDIEEKYRLLIENIPSVTWITSEKGKTKFISPNVEKVFGYTQEEVIKGGVSVWLGKIHPEDVGEVKKSFERMFTKKEKLDVEYRIQRKGGEWIWIHNIAVVALNEDKINCAYGTLSNINDRKKANKALEEERNKAQTYLDIAGVMLVTLDPKGHVSLVNKKLENQLHQAQKMEAMGTLAGGIAHDFNNILYAIMGYTELSQMTLPEDSEALDNLNEIIKAGNRAKELVKQILTFSRQTNHELIHVEVNLIIMEVLKLISASLPSTIEIHHNLKSDLQVLADPTQIHQIMMNLCTNAGHAMRQNGGTLNISLNNVELDFSITRKYPELRVGPYVKLSVQDTGHGIQPDVVDRIFEPFYTTKEKGDGTGMGLSVVHGIVKSYGGIIDVYSKPGKGATFNIFLPAAERRIAHRIKEEKSIPKGDERILFIDDEVAVSKAGKKSLESLGYNVNAKTSSMEALTIFKGQPDKFDLVITDMTMPEMTGDELAREINAIRPDIPIILCSGYCMKITKEKAIKMNIKDFLAKPIALHDLAYSIRNVMTAN